MFGSVGDSKEFSVSNCFPQSGKAYCSITMKLNLIHLWKSTVRLAVLKCRIVNLDCLTAATIALKPLSVMFFDIYHILYIHLLGGWIYSRDAIG